MNSKTAPVTFNDPQVCKNYIVNECPSSLFNFDNEKVENFVLEHLQKIGPPKCHLMHVEELKQVYKNAGNGGGYQRIEQEALERLRHLVKTCDEQINAAKKGLEINFKSDDSSDRVSKEMLAEINNISKEITTMLVKVEDHVKNSQIVQANLLIMRLDTLKRIKQSKEANLMNTLKKGEDASSTRTSRLTVCDICGAYLSIHDYGIERRLYDHTEGLMHKAFKRLREILQELEKTVRSRDQQQSNPHSAEVGSNASNTTHTNDKDKKRKRYDPDVNIDRGHSKMRRSRSRSRERKYARNNSNYNSSRRYSNPNSERGYKERDRYR